MMTKHLVNHSHNSWYILPAKKRESFAPVIVHRGWVVLVIDVAT
jgi:hypothetical protein